MCTPFTPIKIDAPHGVPPPPPHTHLKMKHPSEKPTPPTPLKSEATFQERIPRTKPQKIGNCHYYLCFNHKTTLKKGGRNSTRF